MTRLSCEVINTMTVEQVKSLDLEAYQTITKRDIELMDIPSGYKKALFIKVAAFGIGSTKETPNALGYIDEDGEYKEYISLNELRIRLGEKGKRYVDEDFELGTKAWSIIIEKIGLGFVEKGSYIPFDDIDPCFRAEHPRNKKLGFNLECVEKFWKVYSETIIRVKNIVDKQLSEINDRAKLRRAEDAKSDREMKKLLGAV